MTAVAGGGGPVVVLVGPPGAGKTTVAGLLAARLGLAVRDTDDDVAVAAGKPVTEVFVDDGEQRFRELEHVAVVAALTGFDGVLALGGGAVLDVTTRAALATYRAAGGTVVFLDVTLSHAAGRVGFNRPRPVLLGNPRAQWAALMEQRRGWYEEVASVTVLTDRLAPEAVAERVDGALTAPGPGTEQA
ncbi:MAG TPA: shikimate kinase [Cellulomonas sp.]